MKLPAKEPYMEKENPCQVQKAGKWEVGIGEEDKMILFLLVMLICMTIQAYALFSLPLVNETGMIMTMIQMVFVAGSVTYALICGRCAIEVDFSVELVVILVVMNILPFCVVVLQFVSPFAIYTIIKVIYYIVLFVLGILPALLGGIIYLISGFFSVGETMRMVLAAVPTLVFGFLLGQKVADRFFSSGGGGSSATIYDSKGNRYDMFFH